MDSGSSSTGGNESPRGLNFGEKIFYGNLVGGGGGSSSAPPQEKSASQAAPPRCQVEGCGVDLTGTKAYYCRHKVCGPHSKSPAVVVAGLEQRFCQQCSRFHQLQEFDQGKRSCRRRLAGHNERRRKPLLGPISRRIPPPHLPPFQGGGGIHMDFYHPGVGLPPPLPPWLGGTAGPNGFGNLQPLSRGNLLSHSGEGLGVSDPGCALSLLSTQLLDYSGGTAVRNSSPAEGFSDEPWGLKRHDERASAISDDGQFSGEPSPDAAMGRVSGFSGGHLPWLP